MQRRKVWLTPTTRMPCSNAAKTRNPLKFAGVPQTNETILAAIGPKFTMLWGHVEEILLLNKFFPIVDMCLVCKDIARQSCAMVPRWRFLAFFASCVLSEPRAADLHVKFALKGHTMCGSMADIQSATAEIRRGKKEKPQHENVYLSLIHISEPTRPY